MPDTPERTPPKVNYLTIPEAEELFNRSLVAIKRDIRNAIAHPNHKFRGHFYLELKDGTRIESEQCEKHTATNYSDEGMIPCWYVDGQYLLTHYGRKGEPVPSKKKKPNLNVVSDHTEKATTPTATADTTPGATGSVDLSFLPDDVSEQNRVLRYLYTQSQEDLATEKARYSEFQPIIKMLPDAMKDQTKLLEGMQTMMKNSQFLSLPREAQDALTAMFGTDQEASSSPQKQAEDEVTPAHVVDTSTPKAEGERRPSQSSDQKDERSRESTPVKAKVPQATKAKPQANKRSSRQSKKPSSTSTKKTSSKKNQSQKAKIAEQVKKETLMQKAWRLANTKIG